MKTVVVIPAYNEATVLASVVTGVVSIGYEVVVVNDGSHDNTALHAEQAGAHVVTHCMNRGQGAALQTGIEYALLLGADIVVTFDADGQFTASEISRLVEPITQGRCDVVLGSRFIHNTSNVPLLRGIMLRIAVFITKLYTGLAVSDTHNGFRAFSAAAARKLHISQDGMAHASEIIEQVSRHQWRYQEVPVTVTYSDYSLSKGQKMSNSVRIMFDLLLSRMTK
jgi:glycosyltransferase involved in cell wall biosynthesis